MTDDARPLLLERRERYAVFDSIASGGMASVHIGVALGALGFSRLVAVKRLHPQFARNQRFVDMLQEEARLAARVRHVNVVQTLDILEVESEVFMVMEYVRGLSVADLVHLQAAQGARVPPRFIVPILVGALRGLHAAHEAMDWDGSHLSLVHRDFSPQNILVGVGGVPRVIDFGVAKARGRGDLTREEEFKGKLAYAAPEQLTGGVITRQSDIFSAGIIFWELLTGARLFLGPTDAETFGNVLRLPITSPADAPQAGAAPTDARAEIEALAPVALRALERDPGRRYASALEMASAMEAAVASASASELGHWIERLGAERFAREHELVRRIELAVATGQTIRASAPEFASVDELAGPPAARLTGETPIREKPPGSPPRDAVKAGVEAIARSDSARASAPRSPVPTSRMFWLIMAVVCMVASAAGSALVIASLRR